jgi:hypothetical protein
MNNSFVKRMAPLVRDGIAGSDDDHTDLLIALATWTATDDDNV